LAYLASGAVLWVEQVCPGAETGWGCVCCQILGAGLAGWGIEEGDFAGLACDGLVPGGEDHEAGHEVVVWVEVV